MGESARTTLWDRWALPALSLIQAWDARPDSSAYLNGRQVHEQLGAESDFDRRQIDRALHLLVQDDLIDAEELFGDAQKGPLDIMVKSITARGMQMLGEWPRPAAEDRDALAEAMNSVARAAVAKDPKAASALRNAADIIANKSVDFGLDVLKAWALAKLHSVGLTYRWASPRRTRRRR